MIRIVANDFERLQSFLTEYRVQSDLGAKAREDLLKRAHKRILAALQVWAIMESLAKDDKLVLSGVHVVNDSDHFRRLGEFFSDVVSGAFSGLHALYKPGFMAMRSGVENFVRALAGLTSLEARTTTVIYKLFECAAAEPIFEGSSKVYFNKLQQQYGDLCLYSHTAGPGQMYGTAAFSSFHKHDTNQFRLLVKRLVEIIDVGLAILVFAAPEIYLKTPTKARDLLDEVLPSDAKIAALGGG